MLSAYYKANQQLLDYNSYAHACYQRINIADRNVVIVANIVPDGVVGSLVPRTNFLRTPYTLVKK